MSRRSALAAALACAVFLPALPAVASGVDDSTSGIVSRWRAGGSAVDDIGGLNGTLVNDATYADGISGQALSFDGYNDAVVVGARSELQMSAVLTIEAWICPTGREGF